MTFRSPIRPNLPALLYCGVQTNLAKVDDDVARDSLQKRMSRMTVWEGHGTAEEMEGYLG